MTLPGHTPTRSVVALGHEQPGGDLRQGTCSLGSGLCRAGELARTVGRRSMQKRAAAAVTRLGYASWRRSFNSGPAIPPDPAPGSYPPPLV